MVEKENRRGVPKSYLYMIYSWKHKKDNMTQLKLDASEKYVGWVYKKVIVNKYL